MYLQRSYDENFLHQGRIGLSGEVQNGRKRFEWDMGSKRKAATMC